MQSEYIERELVKITRSDGKVEYFAVTEKTAENMIDTSSAMQYIVGKDAEDYNSKQFDAEIVGVIQVELE